jgi:hypothetical protein
MDIALLERKKTSFSIFGNEKKAEKKERKIFTFKTFIVCAVHLVAFNHFARRHT